MTSLQARRELLEHTLQGLKSISSDNEEALQHARLLLAAMGDEDSDSDKDFNNAENNKHANQCQQQITHYTHGTCTRTQAKQIQLSYTPHALENSNLEATARPSQTQIYEDNINEEDMSLASEDDDSDSAAPACPRQFDGYYDDECEEEGEMRISEEETQVKVESSFATNDLPRQLDISPHKPMLQDVSEVNSRPRGMLYEVRFVNVIKNEVPLLTKINPALQVDVARLHSDLGLGPLFWSLQVECAEHQTKWELATFVDEASSLLCKRSRTEFADSLLIPVDFSGTNRNIRWLETLPDVQLRAEREVWDPRARACQAHRHRFQFRIALVDASKNLISQIAFSSPFRLASCFAALDDSIPDQVLKARRIVRHMGDDEIRDRTSATSQFVADEREQIQPQVLGIDPKEITITDAEFSRIGIL